MLTSSHPASDHFTMLRAATLQGQQQAAAKGIEPWL
jgi:hypothetical protein